MFTGRPLWRFSRAGITHGCAVLKAGIEPEEVRNVMGNDPERREITDGLETWGYRTNYAEKLFTTITFKNGKVSGIKQHSN